MSLRAVSAAAAGINSAQILGTTTNNDAAAGIVGEYISSTVLSGAAVPFVTTNVAVNVTSISLTAGDWDVSGNGVIDVGTISTQGAFWVSSTSATIPTLPNGGIVVLNAAFPAGGIYAAATGTVRFSLAATTTVYLSARHTFTGTAGDAYGTLRARRVR